MKEDVKIEVPFPTKGNLFLKNILLIFIILAIFLLSIWIGLLQFSMPEVVPKSVSQDEFSAERAMEYLEEIAVNPRPIGSVEHERVRDYIMAELTNFGVSPEIQIAEENLTVWGVPYEGKVENIVARIPGKDSSGTIMITSHYDSEDNSPGAADAGSGVVAILETVRALTESSSLKNDLIILISDGEEIGLLGAQAFVQYHPWAKDVDIVLNFEARGSSGPSVLFETNDSNERLVKEFVKGASYPVTHSFIYDLYQVLPNDTDLSIYKSTRMYGLNFGFFDGVYSYHTPEDTVENLSMSSLQHHGNNMIDLVRHYGSMKLEAREDGKSLYFNVIGKKVVTYSEQLVLPIMVLAIVLFVLSCFHGYKRKELSLIGMCIGFLLFLMIIALAYFAGKEILILLTSATGLNTWIISYYPSISHPVFISTIMFVFAINLSVYIFALKRVNVYNLTIGGLFGWLVLVCISSVFFKGTSYVFVWPLVLGIFCFNLLLLLKDDQRFKLKIVSLGTFVIPVIFTTPIVYLIFILFTLQKTEVLTAITSILTVYTIPAINLINRRFLFILPIVLLLLGFLNLFIRSLIGTI